MIIGNEFKKKMLLFVRLHETYHCLKYTLTSSEPIVTTFQFVNFNDVLSRIFLIKERGSRSLLVTSTTGISQFHGSLKLFNSVASRSKLTAG